MPAHLLEGYFQLPAHHEPQEDLLRIGIEVATQKGLGFELSFRITYQDPAHGHRRQARGVPNGPLRSELDHTLFAPIPLRDLGWLPNGLWVFGHHRKIGQALALYARSSYLSTSGGAVRLGYLEILLLKVTHHVLSDGSEVLNNIGNGLGRVEGPHIKCLLSE
jgi:hypothetical protein